MASLTVSQDWLDEAFKAVEIIREKVLPIVHTAATVAEMVDPADAAIIAGADLALGKIFEVISRLQSKPKIEITDAELREETVVAWHLAATFRS